MSPRSMAGLVPRPRPEELRPPAREDVEGAKRDPAREILNRLARGSRGFERFDVEGRIGEGGMGVVLRVHDPDLNRTLALKRMKSDRRQRASDGETPEAARRIARFLDEAQVTGQLDHPGIIPVHELGLDPEGQPYFTMKLVRGSTLQAVIPHARESRDGWSTTRAVGVLLRICEAMSYAHAHGVVHRDLKPANVMLGRFGEVYVMDWGLARVFGGPGGGNGTEFHDLRHGSSTEGSPLVTEAGEVFGTPAYMSPEQAMGEMDAVGPRTDVYAVGAILYELLSGVAPFTSRSSPTDNRLILARLRDGPPAPIEQLARSAPAELVAICRRAMERNPERRYESMQDLADDLRAYLEVRVVRAYRTGPLVELRKWIERNRGVATLSMGAIALVAVSGFLVARVQWDRTEEIARDVSELRVLQLPRRAESLPLLSADSLEVWDEWLRDARVAISSQSDFERDLRLLLAEHTESQRIEVPDGQRSDDSVLRRLESRLKDYGKVLAELEVSATHGTIQPHARQDAEVLRAEIASLPCAIEREKIRIGSRRGWRFADDTVAVRHERLESVCSVLRQLALPTDGLIASVARTVDLARAAVADHGEEWDTARREIATPSVCPAYEGELTIEPQLGLVPLGRDPESGLYEFWHMPSGDRPQRGTDGRWDIQPASGLVFVLVPGGKTIIGVQQLDPMGPNYAPIVDGVESQVRRNEHAPIAVTLGAYFLSRYELTQGQWLRLTGSNPSEEPAGTSRAWRRADGSKISLPRWSRTHPVEGITWLDCWAALPAWGLDLPTEAQWEHAARAGRATPYWTGDSFGTLRGSVNYFDPLTEAGNSGGTITDEQFAASDDRWPMHAPVDAFPPNPWGFHSISGNVEEYCRDTFGEPCGGADRCAVTGENRPAVWSGRAIRGGSFRSRPGELRLSRRYGCPENTADMSRGVRPTYPLVSTTNRTAQ